MIKLRLIFKKHGEETKRNLQAENGMSKEELWKYANQTTKERWPELKGTMQEMEIRR